MAHALLALTLLTNVFAADPSPDNATTVPETSPVESVRQEYVRVTFYTLRGRMSGGRTTYSGAAACSKWIPLGTLLEFSDGWQVVCEDRGDGDNYWKGWVDVWAPSRAWGQSNVSGAYGDYTWVKVLRWGPPTAAD